MLPRAIEMNGAPGVYGLTADTGGIDGSKANAGTQIITGPTRTNVNDYRVILLA